MVIKCKFLQRGNVEKFYCSSVSENNNNSRHYRVVKALYHHLIRNFIFNVQFITPYSHTSLSYLLTMWNKVKRREIKSLHLTLFNAVHWQAWNKVVNIFTIHNRFRLINWTIENKLSYHQQGDVIAMLGLIYCRKRKYIQIQGKLSKNDYHRF